MDFHYLVTCSNWLNTEENQKTVPWMETNKGRVWQVAEVEQKRQAKSKICKCPNSINIFSLLLSPFLPPFSHPQPQNLA